MTTTDEYMYMTIGFCDVTNTSAYVWFITTCLLQSATNGGIRRGLVVTLPGSQA